MAAKQELDGRVLRELFPELDLIGDEGLRAGVEQIYLELWELSDYERVEDVPVMQKAPYPQLKHTQAVLKIALAAAEVAEQVHGTTVDRDVLIAGALLMDVSKFVEYRPGAAGHERTELGALLPHGTATANIALRLGLPLEVSHIVLAHSPNGGKAPATVEAHILDWLDQLDLDTFGAHLWARKVIHLQP